MTSPIAISTKPTGIVKNSSHIYAPVPLLSFHIDPPWNSEVTKESAIGEIATRKPARIN